MAAAQTTCESPAPPLRRESVARTGAEPADYSGGVAARWLMSALSMFNARGEDAPTRRSGSGGGRRRLNEPYAHRFPRGRVDGFAGARPVVRAAGLDWTPVRLGADAGFLEVAFAAFAEPRDLLAALAERGDDARFLVPAVAAFRVAALTLAGAAAGFLRAVRLEGDDPSGAAPDSGDGASEAGGT